MTHSVIRQSWADRRIRLFRGVLALLCAVPLCGAAVSGRVELKDSRDPAVKNRRDFSGVVISLTPLSAAGLPVSSPPRVTNAAHLTITQRAKTFIPHMLAIQVGTWVDFPNLDPIFHNAFSSYSGQVFDVGLYPPGTNRSIRFTREGVVRVFCNIHSAMSALIVVLATPHFAITKRDGTFEIADVPAGEYELRVVHERATDATLQTLSRRVSVTTAAAPLGILSISESGYLPIPHKDKYGRDYAPEAVGLTGYTPK